MLSPVVCSSEFLSLRARVHAQATLLADYGAEVIKIENPGNPDVTRTWGYGDDPARTASPELHSTVEGGGSSFVQLNRGKKSIGLNPMSPEGKEVFLKLLATADVFITNVRLKSLRKYGLDYEALAESFPTLIYAHLSAFGRSGPMVDDPGYDFGAFWAQSGLMDITKASEDAPPPREPGGIGDYQTGMQLMGGVFAALFDRTNTGKGQLVDAALMRAGVWSMAQPLSALMGGNAYTDPVEKRGNLRGPSIPGERWQSTTKVLMRKRLAFAPFCTKTPTIYQDRLGTHIAKVEKKEDVSAGAVPAQVRDLDPAAGQRGRQVHGEDSRRSRR
jgi:crotonobetainyl-CoA:carnitine CoA-transferase CaiB-like acyl-CoA transferase